MTSAIPYRHIYINYIIYCDIGHNTNFILYADDTNIYISVIDRDSRHRESRYRDWQF